MKKIFLDKQPDIIEETVKLLGNTPYFKTVDANLLKEIFLEAWIFELDAEEPLIRETNKSDRMVYILIEGEFDVFASGKFILKIDQSGQTIGEMAVISPDTPRSADVISNIPSRVVAIESSFLDQSDPTNIKTGKLFFKNVQQCIIRKAENDNRSGEALRKRGSGKAGN